MMFCLEDPTSMALLSWVGDIRLCYKHGRKVERGSSWVEGAPVLARKQKIRERPAFLFL
jgi:hypothetical protein